ncbi:MAG: tetratricopeptide repeat protein [Phycisphaerae bacterium]|nr:tetratricopeptide repeat protein [Phycisphaerae bacterium]
MKLCRAISGLLRLAAILPVLAIPACQPAPEAPKHPSEAQPTTAPVLPRRATVKLDDLSPPIARPISKPYPRRLPAGAAKAMHQARELQKKKNFAAAVEKLQRARDFDPDNPHIRQLLGMAQLSLPNYGEALKNLQAACEYLADDVQMQILLGQLYRNLRQRNEAILHFRTALKCSNAKPSNPQTAYALLTLSRLLEEEGYWTAALECLTTLDSYLRQHARAYESNPLLESLLFRPEKLKAMRGRLLAMLLRHEEAIRLLTNAYHRNRADAQTANWLFEALVGARQYNQAETMLVELAGSGSLQGLAPTLAKNLCDASDDKTMPLRVWRALRRDEKVSAPLAISLAGSARKRGATKQAVAILDDLLKEVPDHVEGVQLLAELSVETGDRNKALHLLARLIRANPQSPDAVAVGVKTVAAGNTDPTLLETFSEQTYQDAGDAKFALHYVAGLLALQENKPLKAADHFQRAIREKKNFYPAYDALLDLHLRAKDAEALRVLLDLCKEVAKEEYYYNYLLGRARLSEGKPDQAIDALEAAREKNSTHVPTLLTLGKAYLAQAERSRDADVRRMFQTRAQSVLQKAIRLTPDATDIYRTLFDLYLEQNDHAKALEVADALMRRRPERPDGALMQAEAFLHAGRTDQARVVLQLLVKKFPDHPMIQLLAVQAILKRFPGVLPRPVYDQSVDRLRELLRKHPDHDRTRRFLAQLLSQAVPGHYDQAAEIWAQIVRHNPDDTAAAETLAMMRLRAGQYEKALQSIRRLRETLPKDLTLRLLEADALVKAGRADEATRLIRTWWDQDKSNTTWVMLLLDLYQETTRHDDALQLLGELKTDSPDLLPKEVRISRTLAFLCRAGRYDQAVALAEKNRDPLYYSVLVDELIRAMRSTRFAVVTNAPNGTPSTQSYLPEHLKKQYDRLISILDKAHAKESDAAKKSRLRDMLLYALARDHRYTRAVEMIDGWMDEIEQAQPRPSDAVAQRAKWQEAAVRMLLSAGLLDEAASRLDTYLANDPNNAALHNLHSSLLSERGKDAQAVRELQRAYALQPKDPSYQNNLAYILAEGGKQLTRAEQLIQTALRSDGPHSTTADTLAWVYYKQGRLGESAEVFASILPEDDDEDDVHTVIWDHAGDVFYRLGWVDRAVHYWTRALRGARDEPVASREIQRILDNTPKKLQAVRDETLPPVAPLGKEVESSIEKTLQEYKQNRVVMPATTSQPAMEE